MSWTCLIFRARRNSPSLGVIGFVGSFFATDYPKVMERLGRGIYLRNVYGRNSSKPISDDYKGEG